MPSTCLKVMREVEEGGRTYTPAGPPAAATSPIPAAVASCVPAAACGSCWAAAGHMRVCSGAMPCPLPGGCSRAIWAAPGAMLVITCPPDMAAGAAAPAAYTRGP